MGVPENLSNKGFSFGRWYHIIRPQRLDPLLNSTKDCQDNQLIITLDDPQDSHHASTPYLAQSPVQCR